MDRLTALIDQAEEQGCVNLSQFSELLQELDLDEDELARVYEELDERGIELSDDCGQIREDDATFANDDLAHATTDALQLFLNEAGRYKLLTAEEEVELAKRIERGEKDGEGPDDQLEPAAGRLDRQALPGARAVAARPDPGRASSG